MITASELGDVVSGKGGITEGNLSYIRSKRWERNHGFTHPVSSRQMEIGNEQEKYAYEWAKRNIPGLENLVYAKDGGEIPFWVSSRCPMGASPDSFTPDESVVVEFKTLVGATAIEFFGDPYTSYEEKKIAVFKDHADQLLGQFLSNDKVQTIILVKYIYQDDDIPEDLDPVDASWRGLTFRFDRSSYVESIEEMRERIILIDKMIGSKINPSEFKRGRWYVENDVLCHEKEVKK